MATLSKRTIAKITVTPLQDQGLSERSIVIHTECKYFYLLLHCAFTSNGYKNPQCLMQYMFRLKTIHVSTLICIGYTMFLFGYGIYINEQSS